MTFFAPPAGPFGMPVHLGPPHPFVGVPVGTIVAFAGQVGTDDATGSLELARCGWLLCDGSTLEVADYPELYGVLGTIYCVEKPEEGKFQLPNLGGQFLRGATDDGKLDPDPSKRKRADGQDGAGTGANQYVGTFQPFALQTHAHNYNAANTASVNSNDPQLAATGSAPTPTEGPETLSGKDAVSVSDFETRPRNMAVHFIIKYTNLSNPLVGLPIRAPDPWRG